MISFTYDRDTLREILFWLLGGFDNRSWEHVGLVAPPVVLGLVVIVGHARALNLLTLGEEEAQSLGLAVQRTRSTLLVVGGSDDLVLDLNRRAGALLRCESRLEVVPGAGHLFEEPGALEEVAALAADWFTGRFGAAGNGRDQ